MVSSYPGSNVADEDTEGPVIKEDETIIVNIN